ncbi:MAG: hypothetical protein LC650_00425 [Actinobacteria bacterium]|nr:hypothetical protein [Actinomycetota bacterium]
MAKFSITVEVERNDEQLIQTERDKNDVRIALVNLLLDSDLTGLAGDGYNVTSVPEVYFPY